MLSQLNVELKEWKKTLTDINDVHKLSSEPTGSQTSTKGAEKIISALQELEKSQKQVKFVMDYQSLGIIPGHSSDSLAATASIFESMAIATSRAVEKLAREPPVNNVQQTQPASKTNQSTVNKPVKSYAKVVQKGKKKTKTTIANNNSNQKVKRSKTPAVRRPNNIAVGYWAGGHLQHATKEIRILLRTGDLEVSEEMIKNWAANWDIEGEEKKLTITQTGDSSFAVFFKSRSQEYKKYIPEGIRYETFRSKRMPIPLSQKNLSTRLFLSRLAPDLTVEQIKEQLHYCYQDIDQSKTEVRFIGDDKSDPYQPRHGYGKSKTAYAKLVSSKTATKPYNEPFKYLPFRSAIWKSYIRPPMTSRPLVLAKDLKDFSNDKLGPGAFTSEDLAISNSPVRRNAPETPGDGSGQKTPVKNTQ